MKHLSDEELAKEYTVQVRLHKEVGICNLCYGKGVQYTKELTDYHRGEYKTTAHKCNHCDGFGLVEDVTRQVVAMDRYGRISVPEMYSLPYNPKSNPEYEECKV